MHNFKKIASVLLTVIIAGLLIKCLDIALYPCTFMRNDMHAISSEKNDVIILGTSNGKMDLDPDAMLEGTDLEGHNICVGGEYPIDAYYITKLALEKQKPKQIIFELDPGYFTTEKEKGNNYLLFYHEFPISAAKIEYFADTLLDSDFRSALFPFYEYPLSYELSKVQDTVYQKVTQNYDVSYLKGKAQEYHENGFIERYPVAVEDMAALTPTLFFADQVKKENIEYLDKLIQLCKDNDVEFVIATMPLPAQTLVDYGESYGAAWNYFSQYCEEREVTYYNFNREYFDAFSHGIENYTDYDGHMNGESAQAFSKVFGKIIRGE